MKQSVENQSDEEILKDQFKKKIKEESIIKKNKRIKIEPIQKKEIKIEEKKIKKNGKFCMKCNKKLKLACDFICRCGNIFCAMHRFHDQHNCSFDYRKEALEKLGKMNPKIVKDKIAKL